MPQIELKNSQTPNAVPSNLILGEAAINTHDGILFFKKKQGIVEKVINVITSEGGVINNTWNSAQTIFEALRIDITNTASAVGSALLDIRNNGISRFRIEPNSVPVNLTVNGIQLESNSGYLSFGSSVDLKLHREAANTLGLRNLTTPQTFNVYNTYSTATSFERVVFKWENNVLQIGTEKGAVGGTARDLVFVTDSLERMRVSATGAVTFPGDITSNGINLTEAVRTIQAYLEL
jgi:hypothetical protein